MLSPLEESSMRLRSSLLVSLLLVGVVATASAGVPEAVAQYRQAFAQALTAGDADAIAGWMAEDVQVFFPLHPFRVDGRDAAKALYAELFRAFPTRAVVFRQPSVRLYGEHTAMETGYDELSLVDAKGQATTRDGKYRTTLVKSGERWRVVMSHRSPLLAPPAGPAR
jgi:uncharacterized protein (TIGR02246 family)